MKIALFLNSLKLNTGYGGHYRSLLSYKNILVESGHEVDIYHYTKIPDSIIDTESIQSSLSVKGLFNFIKYYSSRLAKYDRVICFSDTISSSILRLLCFVHKTIFIQLIPGGKNRRIPLFFTNCIYFSEENILYTRDFSKNKILLSNRINDFKCDNSLISQLKKEYPPKKLNIVRISKICIKYAIALDIAIDFHLHLLNLGLEIQTHLIGIIEDEIIYTKALEKIKSITGIFLITEDRYTRDAKLLLDYYDIAIGIGRGFWEAVSRDLFVIGISKNSALPVLVTNENYEDIKRVNFSTRYNEIIDIDLLDNAILDFEDYKLPYNKFLYNKFYEDYSTKALPGKLNNILRNVIKDSFLFISLSLFFALVSSFTHIFSSNYKNS